MGTKGQISYICFHLLVLSTIFTFVQSSDPDCIYAIYVQTGSKIKAGTDSKISLTIIDNTGLGMLIGNLVNWGGVMGPYHKYYQTSGLDIFSGSGPCLKGPICSMNLTSDGSGKTGWYCDYVEVTSTGHNIACGKQKFSVAQWLSNDRYPFKLSTTKVLCPTAACGGATFNSVRDAM